MSGRQRALSTGSIPNIDIKKLVPLAKSASPEETPTATTLAPAPKFPRVSNLSLPGLRHRQRGDGCDISPRRREESPGRGECQPRSPRLVKRDPETLAWVAIGIANELETCGPSVIGAVYLQGFANSIDMLSQRFKPDRKEKALLERAKLYILREDENVDSHLVCASKDSQADFRVFAEDIKTRIKELARALEII
jgi:hypothetical protein